MEVEACEDFLYIMFNLLRQILFILYRCQIHNMSGPKIKCLFTKNKM